MKHDHDHSKHQEHDHSHHHGHHHHHDQKNIKLAFFLNLSFTIIEIIGGILTNSVAILSDAIHDLGDTIAIGSSYFLEKKSLKQKDKKYTYGYLRLSPLAALLNLVILTSGSLIIFIESIPRLLSPVAIDINGMLIFAVLGIVFNGFAVIKLMASKEHSANSRTIYLHLLEDVLGWGAILVGSIVIHFTGLLIIDPILSITIAFYILYNAIKNLKLLLPLFLQSVPESCDYDKIMNELLVIDKVKQILDLNMWSLDGEYNIATVKILVDKSQQLEKISIIKSEAKAVLQSNGLRKITIDIELDK